MDRFVVYNKKSINKLFLNVLKQQMIDLAKRGWGEPGEIPDKWGNGDVIVFSYEGKRLTGFAVGIFLEKDILNFNVTIVDPNARGRGLSVKLNRLVIIEFLKKFPIALLRGFFVVTRTPNPSLYLNLSKNLPIFPNYLKDRKPKEEEKRVFNKLISMTPNVKYDDNKFVIFRLLEHYPGFIYFPDQIPWSGNNMSDEFFESRVHLKKREGNVLVITAKITPKYLLKKMVARNA